MSNETPSSEEVFADEVTDIIMKVVGKMSRQEREQRLIKLKKRLSEGWIDEAANEIADCTLGKVRVKGLSWSEIISHIIRKHFLSSRDSQVKPMSNAKPAK